MPPLLAKGDTVLCFDGLDELLEKVPVNGRDVALRDRLCQSLTWYANSHQCPMVITSRIRACPQELSGFTTIAMKPFDAQKMQDYAEAYFRHGVVESDSTAPDTTAEAQRFIAALNRNAYLTALAGTPLLLSLICYLYRLEGLPLPAGQTRLFDRATFHLLQANQHRAERAYSEFLKRRVLEAIAFEVTVHHNRLTTFRYEHFNQAAVSMLQSAELEFGSVNLHAVLEDIVSNSGLLQRFANGRYAFLHLSFQEYFVSSALCSPQMLQTLSVSPETIWSFIDKKAWDPDWELFILLLAGKLPNSTPLLKLLANKKKDDYFRHRLALAALCLPEIRPAIRTSQSLIIDRITTSTFSLWWQHRSNGTDAAVPHLARISHQRSRKRRSPVA